MSDAAARAGAPAAGAAAPTSPWIIAILVALAAFMEVLDTTIANVVLPYIAGGMGVSTDEASWVVTTYLVANAISLTASPFLARFFGRKTFFLMCLGLFSVSSILCAQAWNLELAPPVPHPARPGGRGHGAGVAIDFGGRLPARRSAAKPSLCSASLWLWRRWSARRSAVGSPTLTLGAGVS